MSATNKPPHDGPSAGATSASTIALDELRLASMEKEGKVVEGPIAFLYAWFQLFKTAQIHAIDNVALQRPIQKMVDLASEMIGREGRISFQSKDKALFVNGMKLRLSTEEYALAYDIFEFFEERGMGGFVMEGALDVAAIRQLLAILIYAPPAERKFATLDARLKEAGLPFRINKTLSAGKRSQEDVVLERRGYTFLTYSKLVVLFRGLLAEEKPEPMKRAYFVKKIARVVQALVDICMEDDHTFLTVSSVKSGDAYAPHHAANTVVLSIALGEKIGLDKVSLADLGMAALFHDIGMKCVPAAILEKAGPLDASERSLVDHHVMAGVEFLLAERILTQSMLTRLVVAFEHHRHADGSGHPSLPVPPGLFPRIVAIADVYDSLTTDRPWRKAYLPDEALGLMLRESGKQFDALLLKVFVNTMGLYPVGSLVRLSTGELALVVYGGGEGERATRPIVSILGPDSRPTRTVDLSERDASGNYARSITTTENPAAYGLQASGLLAESPGL